jgi:hypothetical protein
MNRQVMIDDAGNRRKCANDGFHKYFTESGKRVEFCACIAVIECLSSVKISSCTVRAMPV